jgi:hypothetical protein
MKYLLNILFCLLFKIYHSKHYKSLSSLKSIQLDYELLCSRMVNCGISKVYLKVINKLSLANAMDSPKSMINISFLIVETNQTLNSYAFALEDCLQVRPWWFVLQLPFESLRGIIPQRLVFIRNPSFLEPSSRLLASINFPNKTTCETNALYATQIDGTW